MPFLSIWKQPTKTIHYLLEKRSLKLTLLIWLLLAISDAPNTALNYQEMFGMDPGKALLLMYIISIPFILIAWPISTGLFYLFGRMLGGSARYKDVLWIIPAASIPLIWLAPVNYFMYVFMNGQQVSFIVPWLAILITAGAWVYSIIVVSKGIGIVHRFSALRGFGVTVIAAGVIFTFLMILSFLAAIFILPTMQ
ncbi:YIP1 family protein [Sporosarcina sp. Te-1]|uniref:YIP1 family protein n=1 Tax=Sporosarcina sp. Te-1 TaxID=2818390 RepID=UPI001A9F495B|nr:YIP1 family protein [Sporosarcina sp. Te-1]QTD39551.1 YIP1 family protein [Sporosarcina sp. Te-1]